MVVFFLLLPPPPFSHSNRYGWHFPEMAKILNDNETFCRVVQLMGDRTKCSETDFSEIMEEEVAEELKVCCWCLVVFVLLTRSFLGSCSSIHGNRD